VLAWSDLGYELDEKRAVLRGITTRDANRPLVHRDPIRRVLNLSVFDLDDLDIATIQRELERFEPRWLHGYASAIETLASSYESGGRRPPASVQGAFLSSENVHPGQRVAIERAYSCEARSFYGMSERAAFAFECAAHRYHVAPIYGTVELVGSGGANVSDAGESGELVVTGLISRSTPLIRYRTGDWAEWGPLECECGRQGPTLAAIEGRWTQESLLTRTGGRITMTALNLHSAEYATIARFQFRQSIPGEADLLYVPGTGFSVESRDKFVAALKWKLDGRVELRAFEVDNLPLTPAGKHRFIVGPGSVDP
jgi:phenylacetate-CoA ligase